jgi:hypothetical protein
MRAHSPAAARGLKAGQFRAMPIVAEERDMLPGERVSPGYR